MPQARANVNLVNGMWILRIEKQDGRSQEYRCTTENQARQLALMLTATEATVTPAAHAKPV